MIIIFYFRYQIIYQKRNLFLIMSSSSIKLLREASLKIVDKHPSHLVQKSIHRFNSQRKKVFPKLEEIEDSQLNHPEKYYEPTINLDTQYLDFYQQYKSINEDQEHEDRNHEQYNNVWQNEKSQKIANNLQIQSAVSLDKIKKKIIVQQNIKVKEDIDIKNDLNHKNMINIIQILRNELKGLKNYVEIYKVQSLAIFQKCLQNFIIEYNTIKQTESFIIKNQLQEIEEALTPITSQKKIFTFNDFNLILNKNNEDSLIKQNQQITQQKQILIVKINKLIKQNESLLQQIKKSEIEYLKQKKYLEQQKAKTIQAMNERLTQKQLQLFEIKSNQIEKDSEIDTLKQELKNNQIKQYKVKNLEKQKSKLITDLQKLKQEKNSIIQSYQYKLKQINKQKYIIFQQNFSLLQKIESFEFELEQKIKYTKKLLKKQQLENNKALKNQIALIKQEKNTLEIKISFIQKQNAQKNAQIKYLEQKIKEYQQRSKFEKSRGSEKFDQKQFNHLNYPILDNSLNPHYEDQNYHQIYKNTSSNLQKYEDDQLRTYDHQMHQKQKKLINQNSKNGLYKKEHFNYESTPNIQLVRNRNFQVFQNKRKHEPISKDKVSSHSNKQTQLKNNNFQKYRQLKKQYSSRNPQSNKEAPMKKFSNQNLSKQKYNSTKIQPHNKVYTKLEYELENLSQQIKTELLELGRKRI